MDQKDQKTPNQPVSQPKDEDIEAISITEDPQDAPPKPAEAVKSAEPELSTEPAAGDVTPKVGIDEAPEDVTKEEVAEGDDAPEPLAAQSEKPWPTSAAAAPPTPTTTTTVPSDSPATETKDDASMAPSDDDLRDSLNTDDMITPTKPLSPEDDGLLGDVPSADELGHPEGAVPPIPPAVPPKKPAHRWLLMMIVGVLLLAIAAGAYAAYKSTKKDTNKELPHVKVGVMMAFSGGSSSMGYGAMKGIQLAKKQLGADNIEITQMDSKCDPKAAADAIKKLIAQHVAAIIGEGCSSASVAALPAANNSKTVMISPSASSTALSIPDDYFFRVVPPDTFQGEYIAQAIYDKGIRSVAVFYTNEPYGTSMNKVFQERFEALGGKVVATASGEPDVIDLKNQMTELKAANPQAIFFAPNSVVSGTAAMKIGREMGIKAPYYGADILYNTTIIDDAPAATDGLTITSFPTGSKSFKQALMNMNDQVNEQLYAAPQAYDALRAIYIATQRGASTGEEIKKQLPSISFDGVSAHIKFDLNGEISDKSYKYDLLQVKNGQFTVVE